MLKPFEGASVRPQALVISPEAPYPAVGGGALRTASLIDYLARRYNVDVITFRENPNDERRFPGERVRDVLVLDLPVHSKTVLARAARNFSRCVGARPPLVDRYSGFEEPISQWLHGRSYNLTLIEHFWCAPYAAVLRDHCERLVLDLHNVESTLQQTTASSESWPFSTMFRRFGATYADLEREWLPRFDQVLVTSAEDARRVAEAAPATRAAVYPNAIPRVEQPQEAEANAIAFSGNLEYHPNMVAIRWFAREIWPAVRRRHPDLEWRLIGKNPDAVVERGPGIHVVGPVADAVRELAAAKIAVVPLRSGSGTRFKILEAWAAGRAVVSTTLGAEGLGAVAGEHLAIADHAGPFIAAIELLLADADLRERFGANGRRLYLERFTTDVAWRALDAAGF
jgi:glycosyltransferase involved in cell wall biosynthesis